MKLNSKDSTIMKIKFKYGVTGAKKNKTQK